MKKVAITTLGCKINQYESASFQSTFEDAGCAIVPFGEAADIVVINTCTVTGKAGAQSRQYIRKAVRTSPRAKIIITGCHAQMAAQELVEMPDLKNRRFCIVGNGNKHLLVDTALRDDGCDLSMILGKISRRIDITSLPVRRFSDRTRAFLRVQDGCNSYCTYCIVPYTRGPSRSVPLAEVMRQAGIFADEGHQEIVVTGIHAGMYGKDLDEGKDITALMEDLCDELPAIRFRLSSIEPLEVSQSLLNLMHHKDNFMPHLHIPLQSGCDEVLSRMNRRYTTREFARKIDLCRSMLTDAAIGIDILVGFPGETDRHFDEAFTFVEKLDCTYLHVFPYSKRPGTIASGMENQIPRNIKGIRVSRMRKLGEEKKRTFYRRFIGAQRPVLVEGKRDEKGLLKGFTDNYIPVLLSGDDLLMNSIITAELMEMQEDDILAKPI